MPYKSLEQERYFHWAEEHGKMPKQTVDEFDHASKGLNLPKYAETETEEEKNKKFGKLRAFLNSHKG